MRSDVSRPPRDLAAGDVQGRCIAQVDTVVHAIEAQGVLAVVGAVVSDQGQHQVASAVAVVYHRDVNRAQVRKGAENGMPYGADTSGAARVASVVASDVHARGIAHAGEVHVDEILAIAAIGLHCSGGCGGVAGRRRYHVEGVVFRFAQRIVVAGGRVAAQLLRIACGNRLRPCRRAP